MNTSETRRLVALPDLKATIDLQGRRYDWVAKMIGVDRFHLSHVLAGRRPLEEDKALRLSALLGVPLFFVFELPDGSYSLPDSSVPERIA